MLGGAARLAGVLGALREVARAPCVNGLLELRRHDLHGVLTARPPSSSSGRPSGPITVFLSHTSRFASSGMSRKSAP